MKVEKMVGVLGDILEMGKSKRKKAGLRHILAKMKKKEVALKKALASASSDKEKKKLNTSLKVNHAHRKKGVKALRKLEA